MANYRRRRPKEVDAPRNGEWSHPLVEKGRSQFSSVANKRRALAADATPTKRVSIRVPHGIDYQYLYDWVEVPIGTKIDNDINTDDEYDPLDTTQFVPHKPKKRLTRQQRAVKRLATLARREEWSKWWNSHMWTPPKKEPAKEEFDSGKQPELIQPKRKRRN